MKTNNSVFLKHQCNNNVANPTTFNDQRISLWSTSRHETGVGEKMRSNLSIDTDDKQTAQELGSG